jgi:hypothetical protein
LKANLEKYKPLARFHEEWKKLHGACMLEGGSDEVDAEFLDDPHEKNENT